MMLLALLACGIFLRAISFLLLTTFAEPINGIEGSGYRSSVITMNLDFLGRYAIWLSSAALTSTIAIRSTNWPRPLLVALSIVLVVYLAMFLVTSYGDTHEALLHGIALATAMLFARVSRRSTNYHFQIHISQLVWLTAVVAVALAGYATIVGWWQAVAVASLVGISGAGAAAMRRPNTSGAKQYFPVVLGTLTLTLLLVLFGLSQRPIMLIYTHHGIFPLILAMLLTVLAVRGIVGVAATGEPSDATERRSRAF